MKHMHLEDDALVALCLEPPAADAERRAHLAACPVCERRMTELSTLLGEIATASADQADAAFPAERLTRQQMRILQRVEQHGTVGRVLTFPAARARRTSKRPTPARRWIAGAAAAGLFVGMLAGHLAHQLPVLRDQTAAAPVVAQRAATGPIRPVATAAISDDDFLIEVQTALERSGPVAFAQLDQLTPVAWAVR
jgi:anti-sigma factor RsiW